MTALFGPKKEEKKQEAAKQTDQQKHHAKFEKVATFFLIRPLVTEKALHSGSDRQYVFKVGGRASKPQIKKEIEGLYGVKVESVNMMNTKSKPRVMRGRIGYSSGFKKAVVKLAPGHKIEVAPQ